MKSSLSFVLALILTSCSIPPTSWKIPVLELLQQKNIRAVYLVSEIGLLPSNELKDSPEIKVVHTIRDFEKAASQKRVALWIDKDALQLVDPVWLHQEPQKYYPIAILGYNEPSYVFGEQLSGFGVQGQGSDGTSMNIETGYSVWMLKEDGNIFMHGYSCEPTAEGLKLVTYSLLDGKAWKRCP